MNQVSSSTPINKESTPSLSSQLLNSTVNKEISTIDINESKESSVPSGVTDILNIIGDSWINSTDEVRQLETSHHNNDSSKRSENEKAANSSSSSGDENDPNDVDYEPDESCTVSSAKISEANSKCMESISPEHGSNVDIRYVHVPVSKNNAKRTVKRYFCPFCKSLQTKFARHLELKHKTETDVQKFINLGKGSHERRKIIETIRDHGNYIHNTTAALNTGIVITSRQRQPKYDNAAEDYIYCTNCKKLLSKRTIRLHYKKCNTQHKRGVREITVMGRRLAGYIHSCANGVLRKVVFPVMRDDAVTRSIKYDELLILYGNKLCDKYTSTHQHDMIRAHLRLLGRYKLAIKVIQPDIDDFASIFRPQYFDAVIQAIRVVAHWDTRIMWFKTPAVATTLTTLLKKCANKLRSECIKKQADNAKKDIEDFLLLFAEEVPTLINRKAIEDQIKQKRQKNVVLPLKQDIKQLHTYLKNNCMASLSTLQNNFDFSAWELLTECTLVFIQIFNRRRAGEIERLTKTDYENQETLDKNVNADLYQHLSKESKEYARNFVRITIRDKLGRTVPVLLDSFMSECINTILKYRLQSWSKI